MQTFLKQIVKSSPLVTSSILKGTRQSSLVYKNHLRSFATGKSKIVNVLKKELDLELKDKNVNEDTEYLKLKKSILANFKMHDELGSGTIKLTATAKTGEQIEVKYDCLNIESLDFDEDEGGEDEEEEGNQSYDDTDEEMGVNFEVIIKKSTGSVMFDCLASEGVLDIRNVAYYPTGKEIGDKEIFSGPSFENLDEELQDEFYSYLADFKIDENLCSFIVADASIKEQKEYVNWLGHMNKFVTEK